MIATEQNNRSYEESAQVSRILSKSRSTWSYPCKNDFTTIHESFCHPDIILEDSISLYTVTLEEAIFVDSGDANIFDPKYVFTYNGQFKNAVKMILMPLSSFHIISESIPQPKVPVIHVANHSRCGSTLVARIFEAIPRALSICEMKAFADVAEFSRKGELDQLSLKRLLKSITMATLKHSNTRQSSIVFLKSHSYVFYINDLFMDVMPFIKHVFLYRHPHKFVQSWEKLVASNKWSELPIEVIKTLIGIGENKLLENYPTYTNEFIMKRSTYARFALIWVTSVAAFNNLVQRGYQIKSLQYEDLIKDARKVVTCLFNYLDISFEIPDLDNILRNDSQAGTPFSSRETDKRILEKGLTPVTDALTEELESIYNDFKLSQCMNHVRLMNNLL